jgi:four helix bundle protein
MNGENVHESAKAKDYKELLFRQRSMLLGRLAYELTDRFPPDEKFGLVSMLRRTSVSIPSSIAKGKERHETRDFFQPLSYADGYLAELETQLLLNVKLGFYQESDVDAPLNEIDELQRTLSVISRKLASNSPLAIGHSRLPPSEEKDSF